MKRSAALMMAAAILAAGSLLAGTGDWPIWSGPNHNLTTSGDGALELPNLGLELLWKRPLGSAYSAISVVDDRLVTAYSDGESDLLVALDIATGKELWRFRIGNTYVGHDGSDDGPVATPTIHGQLVYGLGPRGRLLALRLDDGTLVWSRNLVEELAAKEPLWGFNSSPTVIGGVLVMQTGGTDGHSISALDPATGELLWSVEDDPVYYQSPTVWSPAGDEQIVALTNRLLMGLRPATGEVLWQAEHNVSEGSYLGYQQPVPLDNGRFLLTAWTESRLLEVTGSEGSSYAVQELWQSRVLTLRGAMAVPATRGKHLYGYSGPFLACVDAATGGAVWRSRSPGRGNLVLVDSSLVILTDSGQLVIADATPDNYQERARIQALEEGSVTRPTFAASRILVRNHSDIACVGPTETAPGEVTTTAAAVEAEPVELLGKLGAEIAKIQAADDKQALIDELLARYQQYPIIEGDDLVHFVFQGEVDDLVLTGTWMGLREELPMHRIEGSDLYFRSLRIKPGGSYLYSFAEFDQYRPDPRNPRRPDFDEAAYTSLFTTPGWQPPTELREPEGARGRVEKLSWKSDRLGNEREIPVYLPAAYDSGDGNQRFPLLIVLSVGTIEYGKMETVLDNLIGETVTPLIVAFFQPLSYTDLGSQAVETADALVNELIPLIDESYRTIARAGDRGIMGSYNGATVSAYIGLKYPERIGKVMLRSFLLRNLEEEIFGLISKSQKKLVVSMVWSAYEIRNNAPDGYDAGKESRRLAELLKAAGVQLDTREITSGVSGWGDAAFQMIWHTWRESTGWLLGSAFPHPSDESAAERP
jgi:outer membrane protein assembly factor BamB/enterochelin esterase-like enzyme